MLRVHTARKLMKGFVDLVNAVEVRFRYWTIKKECTDLDGQAVRKNTKKRAPRITVQLLQVSENSVYVQRCRPNDAPVRVLNCRTTQGSFLTGLHSIVSRGRLSTG